MVQKIALSEYYGNKVTKYERDCDGHFKRISKNKYLNIGFFAFICNFFREVLLPYGYPSSVSSDYLEYQIWDTLQAFCSTIVGTFTTRSILKGVGVGDSEANALSATITWILKDGTGMLGRILFAWWKGNNLDCDSKKWRLFADFLNDLAMFIELFLPYMQAFSMQILCLTSTMKSIVGIAGGATRAAIGQHQAIKGNMAEISAKDGTQETLVNLLASFISLYLLNVITNEKHTVLLITHLISLHLFFNYKAVKSLVFMNFNNNRLNIVLKEYLETSFVLNPLRVNKIESVFLGCGLPARNICGFDIKIGHSMANIINKKEFLMSFEMYKTKSYIIVPIRKDKTIYVYLETEIDNEDIIEAYIAAIYMGRTLSNSKKEKRGKLNNLDSTIQVYDVVDELVKSCKIKLFKNGWDNKSHAIYTGPWKSTWKKYM